MTMTSTSEATLPPAAAEAGVPRLPTRRLAIAAEVTLVAVVILGAMAVTALPSLYGYRSAPADKQFMGIVLNVPDTAQYFSWARESAHAFFIENKLTAEHGPAVFFNLFWLLVGRLAVALHLGIPETTQLVRPLAGAGYLAAIYWFSRLVLKDRRQRWIGFLVVAFGGGLGWLLVLLKQFTGQLASPLDLYTTEPNTFLTVMAFPHQAAAGAAVVLILGLAALAFERESPRLAAVAGGLALLLGVAHGYDLLIVYAVLGVATLLLAWRSRAWVRTLALGALVCGPSAPAAAYLFLLTERSPIWRGVLAQYGNAGVFTPSPAHLLILMGLPLVLLVVRRGKLGASGPLAARELVLRCWLVVGFVLLYLPTNFQIKMLAGWQVPVGLLATRLLFTEVAPALGRRLPTITLPRLQVTLGALFLLAVLPANLYLFAWRLDDLHRHSAPYYLSRDEIEAMRWLGAHSQPSDVVLSSEMIGQYLPSVSGNNAFLAHWAETLHYYQKRSLVTSFFSPAQPESERVALLTDYQVRFVFYSDEERALGSYDPGQSPDLTKVFSSAHAAIYQVRVAGGAQASAGVGRPQ